MKIKLFLFVFILGILLQSCLVSAYEFQKTEISIDSNGNSIIKNLFFIDSTEKSYFLFPVYDPQNTKIYDKSGDLNFSYSNGSFIINLREHIKGYSFTIEYVSLEFTSKSGSEWLFSYDYYKLGNFDEIDITVILPENTKLHSTSPYGVIYSDEGLMKIDFDINPLTTTEKVEVKYTFGTLIPKDDVKTVDPFHIYVIILAVIIIAAVLFLKKPKFKFKEKPAENKDFSKEQKDLIRTLTDNERNIVSELFKSDKGLTQKKLSLETGIPKATLSRTLKKLEAKTIIEMRTCGNTNIIILTKWFLEK